MSSTLSLPMSSPSLRYIAPLAALTGVGLITSDLYLASLPALATDLNSSLPRVQSTLVVFMASLALSQLFWGKFADILGMRHALLIGVILQCVAGIGCALAAHIDFLIACRVIQGIGAGAATVIVPALLRRRFADTDAVRAIAWLGIVESVVPAISPVLGTLILLFAGWRSNFWFTTALTLLFIPFIISTISNDKHLREHAKNVSYRMLLQYPRCINDSVIHALSFAALITFVASAPHIIHNWLYSPPMTFAVLQVTSVIAFMVCASRGSVAIKRLGTDKLMHRGGMTQLVAVAGFVAMGVFSYRSAAAMVFFWILFCAGIGLRAPATMTRALSTPSHLTALASGLLMFTTLMTTSLSVQLAGFLLAGGFLPVALLMLILIMASLLLQQYGKTLKNARDGGF